MEEFTADNTDFKEWYETDFNKIITWIGQHNLKNDIDEDPCILCINN